MGLFRRRKSPQQSFADEVLRIVRSTNGMAEATYDADDFAIRYRLHTDDGAGTIYLHNTFRETIGMSGAERTDRIRRLVAGTVSSSTADLSWSQVRTQLRPVLRGVAFGQGTPGEKRLVSRPAMPYLVELVVIDQPTAMAYVMVDRLSDWGVTEAEVFAAARENLTELALRVVTAEHGTGPALVRFLDDGDAYFTSMLLVPGFLAGLADRVGGRPVAFIPHKDALIVANDDLTGLPKVLSMVEHEFREATRSLSPVAYTVDSRGAVVPYQATEPGELANRVHRARVILAAGEYGAQKAALEAEFQRNDVDIFVATVMVVERPDSSLFSVAVWSQDVVTLLPEADFVVFQAEQDSVTVPWAVVARELRLEPAPDYVPYRYHVTNWPPEPSLRTLRADAVSP